MQIVIKMFAYLVWRLVWFSTYSSAVNFYNFFLKYGIFRHKVIFKICPKRTDAVLLDELPCR